MRLKKILIVGSGGREHSLGWKICQSEEVSEILYAPGNAGTQEEKGRNVSIDCTKKENFPRLLKLIKSENVDLTIVGPEAPLVEGLVDFLNCRGYNRVFGTKQKASELEADKFYSYDLMRKLNIPQAKSIKCSTLEESINAINERTTKKGIVIKARGLTGGKGVNVCNSKEQAISEIIQHSKKYGAEVLIAERLFGKEFSVFGISDGNRVSPLEISVQDHKPLLDGDKGPNTGGMGAYCPTSIVSKDDVRKINREIMTPLVLEMKSLGNEYKGFLYAGMMMTNQGPKVIEFNVRFGDPECQPVMMMIKTDLYKALSFALEGKLDEINIEFNPGAACCVVLASQGYPGDYQRGLPITGLDQARKIKNVKIFHAGTMLERSRIVAVGGRVLGVTGYSPEGIISAQQITYEAVSKIKGFHCRKDIADKAIKF